MKIQSLSVIFAIIILPIIITLSYYIHKEVDTIVTQTSYDTKLIDATHDALSAFELNTANEDLSSVADALRSIIEASTNVFFNSLATNLGMSNANKDFVRPYVPAILYTLYDGYYIYSPTRVPEVLVGRDETDTDKLVYVGDYGLTYDGEIAPNIGKYLFDENLFKDANTEPTATKSARQQALYDRISNKSEYGQLLYKNEDGSYSTVLHDDTYYKQDYVLKSFMPYSSRYKGTTAGKNYDLTVNYTLDNYMSVMGYIGDAYYSKTGYLIGKDVITSVTVDGVSDILSYNENDAEEICLSGKHNISVTINPYIEDGERRLTDIGAPQITYTYYASSGNYASYAEQKEALNKLYQLEEDYYNQYRASGENYTTYYSDSNLFLNDIPMDSYYAKAIQTNSEIQSYEARLEDLAAITYYIKAQIFSNWVYSNLGNDTGGLSIRENNIKEDYVISNIGNYTSKFADGSSASFHHDFSTSDKIIFDKDKNPENLSSNFVSHKFDVTKNSIQYNLNLALSSYDKMAGEMDIRMPVLSDSEWEKVLQNVSVVSFMQGFNCGMKYYSNYAIASSTNNELTVIPSEIYYVPTFAYNAGDFVNYVTQLNAFNPTFSYHRIDCPGLSDYYGSYISFRSKEVKYDREYDKKTGKYKYDHRNFSCYNCIVGNNYMKSIRDNDGNIVNGYSDEIVISALNSSRQYMYFRGVAKARQNIYKTNALTSSNGFETVFTSPTDSSSLIPDVVSWNNLSVGTGSHRPLSDIKAIEVSVKNVRAISPDNSTVTFCARVNGNLIADSVGNTMTFTINLQDVSQTITIPVHINDSSNMTSLSLEKMAPSQDVSANLLNVRVIYE